MCGTGNNDSDDEAIVTATTSGPLPTLGLMDGGSRHTGSLRCDQVFSFLSWRSVDMPSSHSEHLFWPSDVYFCYNSKFFELMTAYMRYLCSVFFFLILVRQMAALTVKEATTTVNYQRTLWRMRMVPRTRLRVVQVGILAQRARRHEAAQEHGRRRL